MPSAIEHLKELEFVKLHDVSTAKLWYLIDAQWMKRWKLYVTKHGEHPGPISNSQLLQLEREFRVTRKDLNVRQHYRGLGQELWTYFRNKYGGGPAIVHETLELKLARVLRDTVPHQVVDVHREAVRSRGTNSMCRSRSQTHSPAATTTTTASSCPSGGTPTSSVGTALLDQDATAEAEAMDPKETSDPVSEMSPSSGPDVQAAQCSEGTKKTKGGVISSFTAKMGSFRRGLSRSGTKKPPKKQSTRELLPQPAVKEENPAILALWPSLAKLQYLDPYGSSTSETSEAAEAQGETKSETIII